MRQPICKIAAALAIMALLLPGALILISAPTVSATPTLGRVTVSGTNILVDGKVPSEKFFGVVETTALQFAIMAYIYGDMSVAGRTSHLNGPDTSASNTIPYNSNPELFWHQYFALISYYNCNLVRMGAGDQWGSSLQYEAWLYHHDAYISLLNTMCAQAEQHGVWLCFVLAGSQEYPTYNYGGSGTVFDPNSQSFARYIDYCRDTMAALEGQDAIAMYDLFNEPDHNNVDANYWHGDKVRFNAWERAVAAKTAGASTHPRTMGVAAVGTLFPGYGSDWSKYNFDLATGNGGFEILHRHFYASASGAGNEYLFNDPENWAKQDGKPLFWGELAYNGVYPLTRWEFAENSIWKAGGQVIASMVLTGTPGYPYHGGLLSDPDPPVPPPPPSLVFTSEPVTNASTGAPYSYQITTSIDCVLALSTDAGFLSLSSDGVVNGTPDTGGSYSIDIAATASDGRVIYQNFTLVINQTASPPPDEPSNPPIDQGNTTDPINNTTQTNEGGTTGNITVGMGDSSPPSKGYVLDGTTEAITWAGALITVAILMTTYLVLRRRK